MKCKMIESAFFLVLPVFHRDIKQQQLRGLIYARTENANQNCPFQAKKNYKSKVQIQYKKWELKDNIYKIIVIRCNFSVLKFINKY